MIKTENNTGKKLAANCEIIVTDVTRKMLYLPFIPRNFIMIRIAAYKLSVKKVEIMSNT
jgi:hypothetical protein